MAKLKPISIKPSHRGLLHEELGIADDKPIPLSALAGAKVRAKKTGNTKLMKETVFAQNERKWNH